MNSDSFFVKISNDKLTESAIDSAEELMSTLPGKIKPRAQAIVEYLIAGDFRGAINHLDYIIHISPSSYFARYTRGIVNLIADRLVHALEDFDSLLEYNSRDTESLYYRGYIYLSAGCFEEALENFNGIKRMNGKICLSNLDLYRCICYYNLKELTSALGCINKYIGKKEGQPEHYLLRGFIYLELCRYQKCIADMDYVLGHDGSNDEALYAKFLAHRIMGLNKEANNDIRILLEDKLYYLNEEGIEDIFFDELLPSYWDRFILN